jgi:FKBP-type peptidyl-prolyl cis-trans isomerase (trigger factor)
MNQVPLNALSCSIYASSPSLCTMKISVPALYIDTLYQEVSCAQKEQVSTHGFLKGATPVAYIQEHYKNNILEHIKEFVFKYLVINFLYQELHDRMILASDEPRLTAVTIEPHHGAEYEFEISLANQIDFREWKHFLFKAPKRKNYKDIDRQVDNFIKDELAHAAESKTDALEIGDWVCFDLCLIDKNKNPLLEKHTKNVWLKLGNEEVDIPFQELFLSKKTGDSFVTQHHCFQDYFSRQIDTYYFFIITIKEIVKQSHFSFDDFKYYFRLKTQKEVHQKLIEIFSYRNDLSQRRNIVEEALKLLVSKHHIEVPHYTILRQKKLVLESVQNNPDYQVYKMEPNFNETIRLLATKQVKEIFLIDQLTHKENISVSDKDIRAYLNLTKRQRTKEFIYFSPPPTKVEGQEMPIPSGLLARSCLREKTLNHIIYHLTRK